MSYLKNSTSAKPDRVINRPLKGILMTFFPDFVIKDLSAEPQDSMISCKEQTRRLNNEIAAYKRFNELNCNFVPKLLDYSIEHRWLAIERVSGKNLHELLGTKKCWHSIRTILHQIDNMNSWLKQYNFGNFESCIKDLILEPTGKLYLVDFEPYSPNPQNEERHTDIYEPIINDIMQRILIRSGRKIKLTNQFLSFTFNIFLKKPFKTVKIAARCLIYKRKKAWWRKYLFFLRI